MAGHSIAAPSRFPDTPPLGNSILNTAVPVLMMVKDTVSGLPVPGLEAAVGGAAVILDTLQTMQNNKEDLQKLRGDLYQLQSDIDKAGIGESTNEQVRRVAKTSQKLNSIIFKCDKLERSHKLTRFFQAKSIATQVADVRQSVRDTLQVFQVFSIISIENNVALVKDAISEMGDDVVEIGDNVMAIGDNVAVIDTNVVAVNDNIMAVGGNVVEIGVDVAEIGTGVVEIGGNVAAINKNTENANRLAILDKLARAPARFDAVDTLECMNGTRVKLLDKLIGCMKGIGDSPNTLSPSRLTLVCGIPGSGKSTIAKTVAIRLKNQGLLAASFFFSHNHATRREISLVFSTIAFQLAQYSDEYGDILSEILKEDADLAHATPPNQLERLIIQPLSQLTLKTEEPWVILLDALDECGSDHGETLLDLLLSRVTKFPDHVRFFFTGRPEDPIRSAFEAASIIPITYTHTLNTTLEAPVSDDIRYYLRESLRGEWRGSHGWKVKDNDLDALVTRAGGLFIFASTAVKYIRDRAARHDPQTSVNFILRDADGSKRPRLLDQLYFKIVDEAAPVDDEEFVAQYRRVLGVVVNLLEPLSVTAIANLLGMAFGDVSRIVNLLSSVLLISEESVRIAHLSFAEYITGTIRKDREDLLLNGPAHHNDIVNGSINLMNKHLHRNMCDLEPPAMYAENADIPNLAALVTEKIPPPLRYACMYWASHFLRADNVDLKGLEEWLDTKVLFWLEVLSICDEFPRAAPLIFDARAQYDKIASTAQTDFGRYRTILSDTSQFIATFYDIISNAADHIYRSALPFTPSSSALSHTYPNHFVRVIKGAESAWSPLLWTVNMRAIVRGVAFSPNGKCIAATRSENVEIRSSESGRHILTLKGHTGDVNVVAFSPDGARIASGSDDHTIRIWSADSGRLLSILKGAWRVSAIAFSPDSACIASGEFLKSPIYIWSLDDGRILSTLDGHLDSVCALAFSPDGTRIASGSSDQTIRIWSPDDGQLLSTLKGHINWVKAIAFSPDGARIASGSMDNTIRIWSSDDSQLLFILEAHTGGVYAVAFSPDSARIASGSSDGTIRIWSSDNGRLLSILEGHADWVEAIAFSPDGARIVSGSYGVGSYGGTVRIWSSENGQLFPALEGHTDRVNSIALSPDGARVVSGSNDQTIRIWSSDNGELLSTLKGHTGNVNVVVYSPDGARIASASYDQTIRIWSSDDGKPLFILEGHTGDVYAVVFSLDGARIASCSWDETIRIWSSDGQLLSTLEGHRVRSVRFSPDGAHVISSPIRGPDWSDVVRVWSLRTGKLVSTHDKTCSVEDVVRILGGKQQDPFPPDIPPITLNLPEMAAPKLQSSPCIQVDRNGGRLSLPSGELICIVPIFHLPSNPYSTVPISTSAQLGSRLVLGLDNRLIILDFSHYPHFKQSSSLL